MCVCVCVCVCVCGGGRWETNIFRKKVGAYIIFILTKYVAVTSPTSSSSAAAPVELKFALPSPAARCCSTSSCSQPCPPAASHAHGDETPQAKDSRTR